jgi:N-acetylmuramoyl-L-alanine amidase
MFGKKPLKVIGLFLFVIIITLSVAQSAEASALGSRTLRMGSRGNDVAQLQTRLNNLGHWTGPADRIFGSKTQNGVMSFQRARGLVVDGIAGPQTFRALGVGGRTASASTASVTSSRGLSNRDMDLLARLVSAEARGESYKGQVAVAAVVLNRVKSPDFPNTIHGVVFDRYKGIPQFSPIDDGSIWNASTQSSRNAAKDAVNGWDPTNGALVFYNPSKTSNQWVRNRPYATTIGNHVFRY